MKCLNCETEFDGNFCPKCGAKEGRKLTKDTKSEKEKARDKAIQDVADRVVSTIEKKREERNAKREESGSGGDDPLEGIID